MLLILYLFLIYSNLSLNFQQNSTIYSNVACKNFHICFLTLSSILLTIFKRKYKQNHKRAMNQVDLVWQKTKIVSYYNLQSLYLQSYKIINENILITG
jgi:hypothetical protein